MPREVWDVGKVRQESQRERDIASQLHRDAMATRAKRSKAREKSDRVARYLDASLDEDQAKEAISIGEFPQEVSKSPYVSLPAAGPMDYLQPSLTPAQGQALTSLGDFSVLEAGGSLINVEDEVTRIARIIEEKTPGAGGTYAWWMDEIRIPTRGMGGANLDQLTRHELLHRLTKQLSELGILGNIPLPEMQAILEKFDNFKGDASVQDFINFVQMNDPTNVPIIPSSAREGRWWDWKEDVAEREGARHFDPRARTAGWDYSGLERTDDGGYIIETGTQAPNLPNVSPPWVGSSERGKQDYEDWLAYQRELPSEQYGGGVVGHRFRTPDKRDSQGNIVEYGQWFSPGDTGDWKVTTEGGIVEGKGYNELTGREEELGLRKEAIPWGPSTVNYRYTMDDQGNWIKVPVSTGTSTSGLEASKSYIDEEGKWFGEIESRVGLGNWPMGDEHALLAAQAAKFDLPGQEGYMGEPEGGQYYGKMARFNRAAALKAHPDSRIRAIAEAGIPNIVLDKLTEVLSSGGDEVWGELGSYENAMKYLNQLVQQYQSGQGG